MAEATQHNLKITMKCFKGLKACSTSKKIKMVDGHKNFSKAKMSNKFSVLTPKEYWIWILIYFLQILQKIPNQCWNEIIIKEKFFKEDLLQSYEIESS